MIFKNNRCSLLDSLGRFSTRFDQDQVGQVQTEPPRQKGSFPQDQGREAHRCMMMIYR